MRHPIALFLFAASAVLAQSPAPSASPAPIPNPGPLTPEQELASFKVAPGFKVELVAAEPLVDHPVAMDVDADGRLWVVEMPSYMKDVHATDLKAPTGRVVVLEDTDGDGRMDKRTVFLDGLVLPRMVKAIGKGALVGEPPHLWYCPDADGDLKADSKIAVTSDYFLRADNPELGPNTAVWALDNWIYHSAYASRLRWQKDGTFAKEGDLERGQWGLSQDDSGRLIFNINHDQLRADIVPAHYYLRNPSSLTHAGVEMTIATTQTIWPARATPDVNEGYKPEMLRADGTLKEFTAACGPVVYRGTAFPADCQGNAFVCEPAANLVKRDIIRENGLFLEAKPAYDASEFLAARDPWFRPVSLANSPDGSLLVCDMYKGIILYKPFMSEHMKKMMAQRRDPPTPLGRIWRVVPDTGAPKTPAPRLSAASTADLVKALENPSGWWRDTAQRLLVERGDAEAVPLLKALASGSAPRPSRVHALWTLEGLVALEAGQVVAALKDQDRKLRVAGLRLAEPFLAKEPGGEVEKAALALATDKQREVRVQAAFSLGEGTSPEARAALLGLLSRDPGDIFVVDAVLSSSRGREMEILTALRADATWKPQNPGRVRTLRALAQCVAHARVAEDVAKLVSMIAEGSGAGPLGWQESTMLEGIDNSVRFGSLPAIRIAAEPPGFEELLKTTTGATKDRVKEVLKNLMWPGKTGYTVQPEARALTAEEVARVERGRSLYASSCAACHQSDGMGQKGRAPPLLASMWVNRVPGAAARIVLGGLKGPITVHDTEWKMEMPPLPHLTDDELAAVLTYVRRSWGNTSDPVEAKDVAAARADVAGRKTPWSAAELEKLK